MKKLITATTIALAFTCVGGVSVAQDQDQTRTTNMQNVTVTQVPAQYETYLANLDAGFNFQAVVGSTRRQFVQAQRVVDKSETLRMRGLANQPVVSVAIDNSSGPGLAKQIQLINSAHETVAIVNVYCKRQIPSGGAHCRLAPRPMQTNMNSPSLASAQAEPLQLVQVDLH